MTRESKIAFHQIDILLPVQQFDVSLQYTAKEPMSFMTSMTLRLLRVAPLPLPDLAYFLGLDEYEVNVLAEKLIGEGLIQLNHDNKFELSSKGRTLFTTVDSIPNVTNILNYKGKLTYEMVDLSIIKNQRYDADENGLVIQPEKDNLSKSEQKIREEIALSFRQMVEDGLIELKSNSTDKAHLYKVESVKKKRDGFKRFTLNIEMSLSGEQQDVVISDDLSSTIIDDAVLDKLYDSHKASNLESIYEFLEENSELGLGNFFDADQFYPELVFQQQIREFAATQQRSNVFVGPSYRVENQERIIEMIQKHINLYPNVITKLRWLAPSDSFWGKSSSFTTLFDFFINAKGQKSKLKTSLDFKCLLPITGPRDNIALHNYRKIIAIDHRSHCYGVKEGSNNENVEVILLEGVFCIYILHVYDSSLTLASSFPLGVISFDKKVLAHAKGILDRCEKGVENNGNGFGAILRTG